jgi:hypothetical protein
MWPHVAVTLLGIWVTFAPAVLGYGGAPRVHDRIVGPLIASIAFVATSEVVRELRWVAVTLGIWLIAMSGVLGYPAAGRVNATVIGILVVVIGSIRGPVHERFGGGWRAVARSGVHVTRH